MRIIGVFLLECYSMATVSVYLSEKFICLFLQCAVFGVNQSVTLFEIVCLDFVLFVKTEYVVYCYAVYEENLHDIEAALIYKNQPLANTQNKDKYNGDEYFISINCEGDIGGLTNVCRAFKLVKGGL